MFFNDEDQIFNHELHELFHVTHREVCYATNLEVTPYGLRSVPTHTEDGIPIRKLYVSNLPPKTTRNELFGVFAQYGFIKSCWVKMGEKGPERCPTATYAFVTYSDPADAYKALQAPVHEKTLHGRNLRISPADSWHQPSEDANGKVCWKRRGPRKNEAVNEETQQDTEAPTTSSNEEIANTENENEPNTEKEQDSEITFSILDVLNRDCLMHVLSFIPLRDLIRSERVSKQWKNMIQDYLEGLRILKTSWWQHGAVTLTTAVLRQVLQRVGATLTRLHIDHHWSALNDRTAHTLGKFCPNLEELKVVGMNTKNWNPLVYGCKQLKKLTFVSCYNLSDSSLIHVVRSDTCIESLTVEDNTQVTGLFLTGSNPEHLSALSFYNCYSLQGTVFCAAIDFLPKLTTLKLDVCPMSMWKIIPMILKKLPKLLELSLSEYIVTEIIFAVDIDMEGFCEALATLTELKVLNLSRNILITNSVMKQVAQTCTKLESLNVSGCNTRKNSPIPGVGDDGLSAVWCGCRRLSHIDVSYLADLTDSGLSAMQLPHLRSLRAQGVPALSATALGTVLEHCHQLTELDVCGCDNVSGTLIASGVAALTECPRPLALYLGGTAAASLEAITMEREYPTHKLLTINLHEDRSNPHLRPDYVEHLYKSSSEDLFDDLYDHNEYDDIFGSDDDLLMDDDLEEYEDAIYAYGYHADNILML